RARPGDHGHRADGDPRRGRCPGGHGHQRARRRRGGRGMNALPESGAPLAERAVHLTRADLLRYAEASGDHNQIHQDDAVAKAVGLPGVIAHGMLTMGTAVQPVVDWAATLEPDADGARARIIEYGVRFTRMVVVDA